MIENRVVHNRCCYIGRVVASFLLIISSSVYSIFDYDRAVATAQQGDWASACSAMTSLLVNEPDNAQLLYDTGVASYKKEDLDQADAYFKRVTELGHASKELQEQAHFNRGNTFVKKHELHKALKQYQKTLELNPDNEQARHNYERVKQMLEQQEQQEQQQNQQKQQEQSDKNQSQDGSEGEQRKTESGSSDDHDKRPNKKSEDQQQEQEKHQDTQDSKDHDNQDQSSAEQNKTQQEEQKQGNEQRADQDEQDKEGQQDRVPDKEGASDYDAQWSKDNQSDKEPDDKQQDDSLNRSGEQEHNSSLDQQQAGSQDDASENQDKNKAADEQGYGYPAGYQSDENLESWVAQVLQKREKEDSTLNKRMIKATVSEKLSGKDEKHCW